MTITPLAQSNPLSQPLSKRYRFAGAELRPVFHPIYAPLALPALNQQDNYLKTQNTEPFSHKAETKQRVLKATQAAGLLGGAILLSRFPAKATFKTHLIPTDWKIWAKAGLGIGAVGQAFQAANWKPPLWLNALTTVAVIHPLIAGFSRSSARKLMVLGPMVAGLAQGTSWLSQHSEKWLDDKANIPPLATKLSFSAGMMAFGLLGFPPLLKRLTQSGLLGQAAKQELHQAATHASSQMAALGACARGCCAGSAVCVSELGEFGSAIWAWLTQKPESSTPAQKAANHYD